jgi:protein associated with RNAse G/E
MKNIKIYRKRMIPDECVLLRDDELLEVTEDRIITKWRTLKPRRDFDHGVSCYYLDLGYKVSKFYRADNTLLYWYCDIVNYKFEDDGETLIASDLLVDVVVYPDGYVKVLDVDELAIAIEKNLCEPALVAEALRKLDKLLNFIYDDKFEVLCNPIKDL